MQDILQLITYKSRDFILASTNTFTLNLIRSVRPAQWSKNLLIFAALIFSHNLTSLTPGLRVVLAFAIFCLLTGAVYVVNDIIDREKDRNHPIKCYRPIASGKLSLSQASIFAGALFIISLTMSFLLDRGFGMVCVAYTALTLAYSFFLKKIAFLDVILISLGFVLRAMAGAVVIHVEISPWLLVCTLFMALFLALSKRRHEIVLLGNNASIHRDSLTKYSSYLLDMMIAVIMATTILAYTLYTLAPRTIEVVGTKYFIVTVPIVIFGIFRYLYLVYQKNQGGNPEIDILKDKPLVIDIILWMAVVIVVLYLKYYKF